VGRRVVREAPKRTSSRRRTRAPWRAVADTFLPPSLRRTPPCRGQKGKRNRKEGKRRGLRRGDVIDSGGPGGGASPSCRAVYFSPQKAGRFGRGTGRKGAGEDPAVTRKGPAVAREDAFAKEHLFSTCLEPRRRERWNVLKAL